MQLVCASLTSEKNVKFYYKVSRIGYLQLLQHPPPQLIHVPVAILSSGQLAHLPNVLHSALLHEVLVEEDVCMLFALGLVDVGLNFLWDDALECQHLGNGLCIHSLEKVILKPHQYLCNCQCEAEIT